MISVRCPSCQKAVGFEEADGGAMVACPFCHESFFVPTVVQPVEAQATPLPTPPPPALPDDLRLAEEPTPPPSPEHLDELTPVEPDPIPHFELEAVRPMPEPAEPIGTPVVVQPTDLAPSLSAAVALSEALSPDETRPESPTDRLEEVIGERPHEDEPRPRRGPKRRKTKRRPPPADDSPWPEGLTRTRVLGAVGVTAGGTILLGTLLYHLSASAWPFAVCCGDLFGLALCGAGVYFLMKG